MVQLFGRITKDASIAETKSGKKVANFSIALNDAFKKKDGEVVKRSVFINCSYWLKPENAVYLTKGKLVEMGGRMSAGVYNNMKGEAVGTINFHVNSFRLYGKGSDGQNKPERSTSKEVHAGESKPVDDLPF